MKHQKESSCFKDFKKFWIHTGLSLPANQHLRQFENAGFSAPVPHTPLCFRWQRSTLLSSVGKLLSCCWWWGRSPGTNHGSSLPKTPKKVVILFSVTCVREQPNHVFLWKNRALGAKPDFGSAEMVAQDYRSLWAQAWR